MHSPLGFSKDFVRRLVVNSNLYFHKFKKPTLDKNLRYCGPVWKNIRIHEMYRFWGILLKISIMERDSGGHPAYFDSNNRRIYLGKYKSGPWKEVTDSAGWAQNHMSLARFKQIRGAFHPEEKFVGMGGDKCYQLRAAINQLNDGSKKTFIPSGNLAFNEGRIACRSRFCPVRQ